MPVVVVFDPPEAFGDRPNTRERLVAEVQNYYDIPEGAVLATVVHVSILLRCSGC
jgi:hypothetical protein